ncbi:hypothetical protein Tco_0309876 [Tanacetum coccineum]
METIHVKFDELTAMAFDFNNSGPGLNYSNFQDSSKEMNEIPSQQDLDNLFGPLYEEYYTTRTLEVSDNFAINTLDNEDTLSFSSIIVEDNDAPQIVTSSEEPIVQESSSWILILMNKFKKTLQNLTRILSCILLELLSSKKLSHLQTIRTHQTCTTSTNNIATLIDEQRIIQLNEFHQQHRYTDR